MSFADKAVKDVLEQLNIEGKEFVFSESDCNRGKYKTTAAEYQIMEQNSDFPIPDEVLEQKSVPDIIKALKKHYIGSYDSHNDFGELIVAEPTPYYNSRIENFHGLSYDVPPSVPETKSPERKSKEDILKNLDKALQAYLSAPEKTVSDFIIRKQNELNIKPAEIYKPVFMTRQNYSKIVSNYTKHPKFDACIQLAFGLKLDMVDTKELLRRAGNAFSDDLHDRVIMYFIEKKQYNMYELNEALDKIGEKPIGNF